MGRHSSPEPFPGRPVLRLAAPRTRPSSSRTVAGIRFPIVDDLGQIAADDRLLDFLAAGRSDLFAGAAAGLFGAPADFAGSAPIAASVAPMLATWRAALVDRPLPALPTIPAPRRIMRGPADRQPSRSLRPILGVAAAICALLMGSVAVGAQSARPGDALWPLALVLYSSHAESVQAQIDVTNSINLAQNFLKLQQPTKAKVPLSSADVEIKLVAPSDGQERLQDNLRKLWVEVNSRIDASAGAPTAASTAARRSAAAAQGSPATGVTGVTQHGAASSVAVRAAMTPASGKPPAAGAPGATQGGGPSTAAPAVPILPTVGPSVGSPSNPGPAATSSATSALVAPVPSSADTGAATGTSTSTAPAPAITPATTPNPSTTADPPAVAASTTSQMPTPTPSTGAGAGSLPAANGAAPAASNAIASQ